METAGSAILAACLCWTAFLAAHLALTGRWWLWHLPALLPPPLFAAVPLALATAALTVPSAARWPTAGLAALCLAAGARQSGLHPTAPLRPPPPPPAGPAVRVAVWNTEHWYQRSGEPEPFYAFLRTLDADVLLLQEYHHDAFDGTWRPIEDERRLREAFPGHTAVVGNGQVTLSRLPVERAEPTAAERVLRTDLRLPGPDGGSGHVVSFYNVHIPVQLRLVSPLRREFYRAMRDRALHRRREYAALLREVAANELPALIAGDFNTSPAIGEVRHIRRLGRDAARSGRDLHPAGWNARRRRWWRLDWALTRPGTGAALTVHRHRLRHPEGLSDHRVQEITLTAAPSPLRRTRTAPDHGQTSTDQHGT